MTIDPNTAPTELLPCPFCGSTDIATDGPSYTLFMCNGCGGQTYDQGSHAEAIAAWNHRAPTAMQPDGMEVVAWDAPHPSGGRHICRTSQYGGEPLVRHSQAATHITRLEAERDALKYGHDEVARFVRRRIPEDQNQEQAENFYAWIGMIYQLETAVTRLEADVARLTKALDEAREHHILSDSALGSIKQNRDAIQRHLNDCTIRAETAEAQNKAMRDLVEQAFRDGLAYGSNVSNGNEPGIASIAWAGSRARAALSTIKEGGGKPS